MAFDPAQFRDLYPFEPRSFDRGGGVRMSYLDEGSGDPVVMVHGNPTWSFYYRELAKALRGSHRVIVPDHIGCGLSDKPGDDRYTYTLSSRIDDLEALLKHAGIDGNVTLVLHDWGGAIGMGWAARHPEAVRRVVLLNTGAFALPPGRAFHWQLKLARNSRLGAFLVRGFNGFSGIAAWTAAKTRLDPRVRRGLVAPYDSWANRIATLRFVQDIPLGPGDRAWPEIQRIESALPLFAKTPALVLWGEHDFVFDRHFLARWREYWPQAEVRVFERAGHYVLEDAAAEIIPLVNGFLKRT